MAEEFDDDLDLSTLNDEDLTEQVHDDLYNGLREEVVEATEILLSRGWSADRVLNEALVEGMRIVGVDFRDGILFVPEVLLAANAMKGGMEILRPLLAETGVEPHRKNGDWYRERGHSRHWQEPGCDDDGRCRF
jgi:methanogenic corrinoid protein MtbC1